MLAALCITIIAQGLQGEHAQHLLAGLPQTAGVNQAAHPDRLEMRWLFIDEKHEPDPYIRSSTQVRERSGEFEDCGGSGAVIIRSGRIAAAVVMSTDDKRCRVRLAGLDHRF